MPAEEVLNDYIDEINMNYSIIDSHFITLKMNGNKYDASIDLFLVESMENINNILNNKYHIRVINRCNNLSEREKYINIKNILIEKYNRYTIKLKEYVVKPIKVIIEDKQIYDKQIYDNKVKPLNTVLEQPQIKDILDIQNDTIQSLIFSKGINVETLEMANKISLKLENQNEQFERIQIKLDELGDGIGRAKKEVGVVMRGILTDKLMICLICIIIILSFIGISLLIGYNVYKKYDIDRKISNINRNITNISFIY